MARPNKQIPVYVFLLLMIAVTNLLSQSPEILWTRTFGEGVTRDEGHSVQQAIDGGFIIAGKTESCGWMNELNTDVFLIKTDANGNQQWVSRFGGDRNDYGYSVQQTTDGGYIIAGFTRSYGANGADVLLIKTDFNGECLWIRTFGGINSGDAGYSVQQTTDGGYIIAGSIQPYGGGFSDILLIKTDANGNEQWNRTYGGENRDFSYCVLLARDEGYVILGCTESHGAGGFDIWLIKTDANGDSIWSRTFGGSGNNDWGYSAQQTTDGGYIIVGFTATCGINDHDLWLIKTDSLGIEQWNQTFGGDGTDGGKSVKQTDDGGYIIGGYTKSFGAGDLDILLIKTDANGDSVWSRTFGGSYMDGCRGVAQTTDGGYIVAGYSGFLGPGGADVYLIRLATETSIVIESDLQIPNQFALHPAFPNPFNPSTTISYDVPINGQVCLTIYNLLGQRITTIADYRATPGSYSVVWNATDYPSGIYFCQLKASTFTQTKKLLLLK